MNESAQNESRQSYWRWLAGVGCLVLILIAIFAPRRRHEAASDGSSNAPIVSEISSSAAIPKNVRPSRRSASSVPQVPATEVVAAKLRQFARSRRETMHAMARHFKVEVSPEMERFFDLAEAGRLDEMNALFESLREQKKEGSPALNAVWPALHETLGVAEEVARWPAQGLLDYGNAVLDSLRPGMVYVGGTDPGRFIPTLLNETGDGERHIVLTQNALADGTYLDYLNFLYKDRLATLTKDDSQRAFQEYLSDAQKRVAHDQQFPNEPHQVRPGEDISIVDNRTQVSGQVAVMAINEKLLQALMQKNPDASFAMEESFPFSSMFGDASALGPIMELRVKDDQSKLTPERAAQAANYWSDTAQELLSDPESADSHAVRMTYAKMAASQAGLLLTRNYTPEAEQAFRSATEIAPDSPEAVFRYINLLVSQKRFNDAIVISENAIRAAPDNDQFRNLLSELNRLNK